MTTVYNRGRDITDESWGIAERSLARLQVLDEELMREQIVRTCKSEGSWSVWMTVFKDDADMLQRFTKVRPDAVAAYYNQETIINQGKP